MPREHTPPGHRSTDQDTEAAPTTQWTESHDTIIDRGGTPDPSTSQEEPTRQSDHHDRTLLQPSRHRRKQSDLRSGRRSNQQSKSSYKVYRSRPGFLDKLPEIPRPWKKTAEFAGRGESRSHKSVFGGKRLKKRRGQSDPFAPSAKKRRFRPLRIIALLFAAVFGWLLLSAILFLVSAQIQHDDVTEKAAAALDSGGFTLTSPNTILILGSDARTKNLHEPGSVVGAPGRSDSIMLLRVGGGHSAKLSIPRDTVVDIPGHGRDKINAAYAYGGPALAIQTINKYLGIQINHVVEVNFDNFPAFIDAIGGIDYQGDCVLSLINGGSKAGGFTLDLKPGTTHIDGKQALALARTRKNKCKPNENDLTRASRQQQIVKAIKDRTLSFGTFFRLPWVAWEAPKALRTDMSGIDLLGLFGAMQIGGEGWTELLRPSSDITLPNGGAGLLVSDSEKRSAVSRFMDD